MTRLTAAEAGGANICAMLDVIDWSEIGPALSAVTDDGYRCIVGSTVRAPILCADYADHPRKLITLGSLGIKSDAAGRYQFLSTTWDDFGFVDFSPANQDRGAIVLLKQCGAWPHVLAAGLLATDELVTAITKASRIWASFPGAGFGQHEQKMVDLVRQFGAALARYV